MNSRPVQDMCVYHRRRHVLVADLLAHVAEPRAVRQHQADERVAAVVGHVVGQPGLFKGAVKRLRGLRTNCSSGRRLFRRRRLSHGRGCRSRR